MRTFTVVPSFEGESAFFELPDIGFQGDNLSFAILFNLTELTEHWPNILPSMIITDPKGNTFIAPSTSWNPSTHIFTWNISSTETTYEGYVLCQLKCTAADDPSTIVCMSRICQTRVYASLAAAEDPPEAFQTWIDTLTQLGAQVQADATSVLESVVTTETNARAAQSAADDAELAKNAAVAARNSVEQTAQIAVNAQEAANQALQRARQAASNAEAAMAAANEAQAHAEQALEDGDAAVNEAKSQASSAADSATQAATSMANANTARLAAEAARDSAIAAKGAAETAQQRAETAEEGAAAARTAAVTARTAAETAQTAAETAKASVDSSKAAIETMHDEMADYREGIEDYAELSRKWAEGKSSSGDAVPPDDETYHNNSKYWANIAATEASTVQGYGLYVDEEGNGRIRSTTDPGVDVSELATKADVIISSASGAIASFPDGTESTAKKLVVGIEPVQDLHGYDHPWPAGGGKNLLDWDKVSVSGTHYGMTFSKGTAEGTVVISGTLTTTSGAVAPISYADNSLSGKGYVFLTEHISGDSVIELNRTYGFRTENEKAIAVFLSGNVGQSYTETIRVSVYAASQTSWTPYENICPISGWTGAKVTRTGKNLLDTSDTTHNAYNIGSIPNILKPNTTYTFSVSGSTTNKFRLYTAKSTAPLSALTPLNSGYISKSDGAKTFTTPSTMDDLLCLAGNNNGAGNKSLANILPQVELGSTATAYEPYQGDTYDIAFPTEAGTVYGGSLDVTNGVLTVDRAQIASYAGETLPSTWISDRDVYSAGATPTTGAQVVYELATPITYHLTPQEITTLLGQNNIWADAGDTSVTYKADTKLYIDGKIAAALGG